MSEKPVTPGPWTVHCRMKDCVTFEGRHGEENLFLENVDGYFACQSEADAKLIAVAPELLKTLINIIDLAKLGAAHLGKYHAVLADAEALIAKATK